MASLASGRLNISRPRGSASTVFKKRTPSEKNSVKNSLDLDRPWEEQSTGFVADNYECRNSLDSLRGSARDEYGVRGASQHYQHQHMRSASCASHLSHNPAVPVAGPAGLSVRGGFVHPSKQTPREPAPPIMSSSYASAFTTFEHGGPDGYSPTLGAARSSLDMERPSLLQRRSNTLPQLAEKQQDQDDDDDDEGRRGELEDQDQASPLSQLSHVNTAPTTSASTPYTPSFPRRSFASHKSGTFSSAAGPETAGSKSTFSSEPPPPPPRQPHAPLRVVTSKPTTTTTITATATATTPSASMNLGQQQHPPSPASATLPTNPTNPTNNKRARIPLGIITPGNATVSSSFATATGTGLASASASTPATAATSALGSPAQQQQPGSHLLRSRSQTSKRPHPSASSTQPPSTPLSPLSPLRGSLEMPVFRSRSQNTMEEPANPHHLRLARRAFEEKERLKAEKQRLQEERKRERADSKESKARAKALAASSRTVSRRNSSSTNDMRGAGHTAATTATMAPTAIADVAVAGTRPTRRPSFSEKFSLKKKRSPTGQTPTTAAGVRFASTAPDRQNVSVKRRTLAAWTAFVLWLRTRLLKMRIRSKER